MPEHDLKPSYYLPRHEFEFYKEATEVALKLKAANSDAFIAKFFSVIAAVVSIVGLVFTLLHH